MTPRAVRDLTLQSHADGSALAALGSSSWQLSPAAAWVLGRANGDATVQDLMEDPSFGPQVWACLDELADAGLLEQRLSPPAGGAGGHVVRAISRREAFGRAAAVVAGAAGIGIALHSGVAHAEDEVSAEEANDPEIKKLEEDSRLKTEEHSKQEGKFARLPPAGRGTGQGRRTRRRLCGGTGRALPPVRAGKGCQEQIALSPRLS